MDLNTPKNKTTELPRGWACPQLGDIALRINPGFPSGKHNKAGKGVPHLRPMNISSKGVIDLSEVKYVQCEEYESLQKGDVLFNNTNSPKLLGKTAYVKTNTDWAYSNHMTRLRFNPADIEPAWIAFYLHNLFCLGFFKMNCVHHVNQASINKTFLSEKVLVPLPPFTEQERIVAKIEELFTKLDAGVAGLKKVKAELKRYRQAVLKHAFEGKLTAEWREKNKDKLEPASKLLKRIAKEREKNIKGKAKKLSPLDKSKLPELPDGWVYATLPLLVNQEKHAIKRGPFGSAIKKEYFVPSGYKVYQQKNAIYDDFTLGDYYIDEEKFKELKAFEVKPEDLIVSCSGTIGRIAVAPDSMQRGVINQALLKITLNKDVVLTKYFVNLFSSFVLQQEILSKTRGSAMMNISSVETVKQIPFALAPLLEQQQIIAEIERHFSIADQIEQTIEQGLKQSQRLRQSILKQAFEGKLVEQNPEDEPAEKLLERIKAEKTKLQSVHKARGKSANLQKSRKT